ncbi:TetR family transcriptional regulator C-terminal domain-containing protein [uncultured Chryseobacterium sp.]|uniref:TetR family transcriptional regulator C-terminal domain-containing protein n=1 Tax=uncultured Chryseobacterium sp. TaxID=259322 RepID=UPI0025F98944|nr:TetR family transcriptional regulator C-terminal domain-containing protein [uncultured Chryseobacterium sp.]
MQEQIPLTQEKIFELYGDYILNHGERPKNVYLFAKDNGFDEKEFYHFFSGFDQIEKEMLDHLFRKSLELAEEVNASPEILTKEKLLNVYFIFFENLTMNRSLVLSILGTSKAQQVRALQNLRETHRRFVGTLDFNEWEMIEKAKQDIRRFNEKARQETLWLHFVSSIDFWKKDTSPDFEKTDIFVEKTIDTGFELMDNEPLRKVIDLGKFLWKEKFR